MTDNTPLVDELIRINNILTEARSILEDELNGWVRADNECLEKVMQKLMELDKAMWVMIINSGYKAPTQAEITQALHDKYCGLKKFMEENPKGILDWIEEKK